MSDQSRRKLLKSIAASGGAIVSAKSLPESWVRPVVDSVLLPAHAQTSQLEFTYSETIRFEWFSGDGDPGPLLFEFDVSNATPNGDGTISVNALGDLNSSGDEQWTIALDGSDLGLTPNVDQCGVTEALVEFNPALTDLVAAAASGTISITATNGGDINDFCDPLNGQYVDVTLSFPALGVP